MEKKKYLKPKLDAEMFVPNEYVAACDLQDVKWRGKCDTSGYIFIDSNNNGIYDEGTDKYMNYNNACPDYYETTVKPEYNAFCFFDVERVTISYIPYQYYLKGKGNYIRGYRFEENRDTHFTNNLSSIEQIKNLS